MEAIINLSYKVQTYVFIETIINTYLCIVLDSF